MRAALLHDLEVLLGAGLAAAARERGITEATARVLLALGGGNDEDGVPMSALARRLGREPSTATRFVDRTVRDGLAIRRPGAQDKRRRIVALTDEGRQIQEQLRGLLAERASALTRSILSETGLGDGQVEWFLEALLKALRDA